MTDIATTAQFIFDHAPLGAVVTYSDGTPRPPARFTRKLAAWERHNRSGRLVKKQPASAIGNATLSPSFTLHIGDYGSNNVVLIKSFETILVTSPLHFRIEQTPPPGSILVLSDFHGVPELEYLAPDRASAETWLAANSCTNARLEPCDAPEPSPAKRFTYLQDPAHGWLLVARDELQAVGLGPQDFSCCSYVHRDTYALEEDGDMPIFLKRLAERGIGYRLVEQHTNHDAYVRRWQSNAGRPLTR